MPDNTEDRLTLRQADEARADFYAIQDDLDFVKAQLARIPTRKELARTALGIILLLGGAHDWVDRAVLAVTRSSLLVATDLIAYSFTMESRATRALSRNYLRQLPLTKFI